MYGPFSFYQLAWYFLCYAFLGWAMEVVFCTVTRGKVVNRGFLNGPVCPIYGFGMLGILLLLRPTLTANDWPHNIALFIGAMILASGVEYLAGWGMLKLFHARWWDYRNQPFNLNGFICLRISLCWGGAALVACRIIHPLVHTLVIELIPRGLGWVLLAILLGLFLADTIVSINTTVHIDRELAELDRLAQKMEAASVKMSTDLGSLALETDQKMDNARLQAILAGYELRDAVDEAADRLEDAHAVHRQEVEEARASRHAELEARRIELWQRLMHKRANLRRLMHAFPDLDSEYRSDVVAQLRKKLENHDND